jgi:hypothetical protein
MASSIGHPISAIHEIENISRLVREWVNHAHQRASELWAHLSLHSTSTTSVLTVHEEAEDLRAVAVRLSQSDPCFAQDMFAAADRHELGDNAG